MEILEKLIFAAFVALGLTIAVSMLIGLVLLNVWAAHHSPGIKFATGILDMFVAILLFIFFQLLDE